MVLLLTHLHHDIENSLKTYFLPSLLLFMMVVYIIRLFGKKFEESDRCKMKFSKYGITSKLYTIRYHHMAKCPDFVEKSLSMKIRFTPREKNTEK